MQIADFDIINKRSGHGRCGLVRRGDPLQPVSSVPVVLFACTLRQLQPDFGDAYAVVVEQDAQHAAVLSLGQLEVQALGIASLFLCVVTMFLLYIGLQLVAAYIFGAALLLFIGSLGVSLREIQISVRALEIYLRDMEH